MSPTSPKFGAGYFVLCRATELYLSVFVLFYRIAAGLWPKAFNADAHKGVAGLTMVEGLFALSIYSWLEIAMRRRFEVNPLLIGAALALIYFCNNHFLVGRGIGIKFENRFSEFPRIKRIVLRLGALGVVLIAATAFYLSMAMHQKVFDIR